MTEYAQLSESLRKHVFMETHYNHISDAHRRCPQISGRAEHSLDDLFVCRSRN